MIWGQLIGMGAGLLSGLFQKKAPSAGELFNNMMSNPYISGSMNKANELYGQQGQAFTNLLGTSNTNFGQATDYWSGLLSGDPSKRRSLMAATWQDIDRAAGSARSNLLNNPNLQRGGAMSLGLSNIERSAFGEKARAATGLEAGAAKELSNIAGQQGQLASSFSGQAGQGYSDMFRNLMGGYQGAQQSALQQQQQNFLQSMGIGNTLWQGLSGISDKSWGNVWNKVKGGFGSIFGGKKNIVDTSSMADWASRR